MNRSNLRVAQHAIIITVVLGLATVVLGQDYLQFGLGDTERVVEIDFNVAPQPESIQVELNFVNSDEGGYGRQLMAISNAPFPIHLVTITQGEDDWYELVENNSSEIGPEGMVLARNIFPNPAEACGDPDMPPCEYSITVELSMSVLGNGVLARAGEYDLKFVLTYNENPITIDFTEFFQSLEDEAP